MLLRFEFTRMPHTSEMWNLRRGFEDLYYSVLFAEDEELAGRRHVWQSWVGMGVDLGIRQAPPAADQSDRVKVVTRSAGKTVEIAVEGGRQDIKEKIWSIIDLLARTPDTVKSLPAAERAAALSEVEVIKETRNTVTRAVTAADVIEGDAAVLLSALDRDIAAFSYPDLKRATKVEAG